MGCLRKHTKYQPTDNEWPSCPKCGGRVILNSDFMDLTDDCDLLHVDDDIICEECEYGLGSGRSFANKLQKQKHLIPCPHCNGTGLIKDTLEKV
ncbi:MAG: hypothetical protein UY48_C0004G0024 [Candidatus Gottesmanbacteria bacterium GW2011_GWB1_49_7]|uniref:Uncharacterized protein n=1 Tax=Candidatus Gottesmanbacteria bacterium GW2011_GWB1_49_7 TaxID=1618448 RepID=A0A0G1Z314_9BACT|nr:MAG: hypothetical protein UY48_C0004G0024 [Candidatus Gottesmanbacteria bacterium GW2011_GWB1_49_7]